jgi:hypothetical protein
MTSQMESARALERLGAVMNLEGKLDSNPLTSRPTRRKRLPGPLSADSYASRTIGRRFGLSPYLAALVCELAGLAAQP